MPAIVAGEAAQRQLEYFFQLVFRRLQAVVGANLTSIARWPRRSFKQL